MERRGQVDVMPMTLDDLVTRHDMDHGSWKAEGGVR